MQIRNQQLREFAEALAIFDKYVPEGAYVEIHGEHDEIMLRGVDPNLISAEDMKQLDSIGWLYSSAVDSFVIYG